MARLFFAFSLLCIGWSAAFADTYDSADRTQEFEINSKVLGETREIIVRTPPLYEDGAEYPVVYVLDGEWNFEFVASYLDYMADNEVFPQMIVTGVKNVNRNRDYVPREDQYFEDTGEADAFLGFVRDEWIERLERDYPASGERIIVGHSFGGVFALHAFFKEPDLFEANMAFGASAWIGDQVLYEEANALFDEERDLDAFVYMAVGEGDGGPTVPSSRELAAIFEEKAPASLEWDFDVTPQTDHFKNFTMGLNDAFMAFFPAWEFEDEVKAAAEADGADGVNVWFDEKRAALGFRFHPAWFDMGVAGLQLSREGHGAAALALMAQLRAHYPDNAYIADFSGSVYENLGQLDNAAREYERAITLAAEQGLHPNAMHTDRLERDLARVRGETPE